MGAGLTFAKATGICMMGRLLARMPWNQLRQGDVQPQAAASPASHPDLWKWNNGFTGGTMDFDALANEHKDAVYRQMLRVCGNREDAKDVLIEALFKAYRHLGQLEHPEAFRAWLARIASRVCWRLKRQEAALPLIQLSQMEEEGFEIPSDSAPPDAEWDVKQLREQLERALRALPEDYRRVYEKRDLEGQSGEKVAEELGISLAAMKSRLHRARGLLRDQLDAALKVSCKEC